MKTVVAIARPLMTRKVFGIYGFLLAFNAAAWALALWAFWSHPILLGTALLAYTFGLRHAVDADHISAIDNVTRKLMQERKRPVSIGFYFSLGHSTVVVGLSLAIAVAAALVKGYLPALQRAGELLGTSISAGFLLLVAAINTVVLVDIAAAFGARPGAPELRTRTCLRCPFYSDASARFAPLKNGSTA